MALRLRACVIKIWGEDHQGLSLTEQVEDPMMNTLKAYGLKAFEALYGASVASVLAVCALMFLLAIVAMAVHMRAIDVQHIHTAPAF